tara:strand:- start:500 stop:976 length:477 start_codon:yes stop_codon:yes gene_type:complete
MAVPSSGLLRMSGLFSEFNEDDYTALNNDGEVILLSGGSSGTWGTVNTSSSSYPTTSNPDKMSEFYGYDHDATAANTMLSFSSTETQNKAACGYGQVLNETYYHDGSGLIQSGDNVYSDTDANNSLSNGNYKIQIQSTGTYYNILVSNGAVATRTTCP